MSTSGTTVDRLRAEAARSVPACPDVELVVLFGSVARDQPMNDSDVDIAVLGADFWSGLRIGSELAALLGREPHVVDLATASDLLRFRVAREGIPLFQRSADAWPLFQARAAICYFDVAPIVSLCAEGARRRLTRQAAVGELLLRKALACRNRIEKIRGALPPDPSRILA